MPVTIPSVPNFNVAPPQVASPMEQYGKMLQLKALSGQVQQQQQMAPLQQQEAQGSIQQQHLEIQQKQLALKTQQAQNTYWSNPTQFQTDAPAGGDQLPKMLGVADDDPVLAMVRGQIKAGVPGTAAIADAKATLSFRQDAAKGTQEQQKVLDDAHAKLQQIATPILAETDPVKKAALIEQARPGLAEWANFDASIKPIVPQLNAQNFDAFANRLGAEQGAVELRSKSADLWKKELENTESVDPMLKMQTNPTENFSGDKLPASIAYLTKKASDPDPKVATMATQLLGVANTSKNVELSIDKMKKEAAQAIADGDPVAAGQMLHDGVVAPSQIISARKPEFAQKAFAAAAGFGDGWNAQKAEADYKVASSPAQVQFFGSSKSLTDKGGTLDQLTAAGKDIPQNKIPVFNTIADAVRASTGSGPVAKYAAVALGVADDYAKVMGGGQGSDSAREQALKIISAAQSPEQRAAAVEGIRGAVGSQAGSRIGNNTVLQRMYGNSGGEAPKTAAAGAGKTLSSSAIEQAAKDHNLTVDQVKAQAKAAGYTIQ
jgi:hypothetical protein